MLSSEWVPSEWESDKNITSNPHHSSPSVNIWRRQKLRQIQHWDVFNFKPLLPAQIRVHNNSSSSEKVHLLLSLTSKSRNIFVSSCFGRFWLVNGAWSVQISLLIQTRTLFHYTKQYYVLLTMVWHYCFFCHLKMMDWSGVDYLWIIVMFLSAVWTLNLTAPIHCRASIAETVMNVTFLHIVNLVHLKHWVFLCRLSSSFLFSRGDKSDYLNIDQLVHFLNEVSNFFL